MALEMTHQTAGETAGTAAGLIGLPPELATQVIPRELWPVWEKVRAGERLAADDGLALLRSSNLFAVGYMANYSRKRRAGDRVFFNNNAHINYSNVCAIHCRFCAFGKSKRSPEGYTMSIEQVVEKARKFAQYGITELHMVGGLHPELPFAYYTDMLAALREAVPQVHLKAFTAIEMLHFTKISGLPLEDVLIRLKEAGLGSMPGGGAEIFAPRVRNQICKPKETAEEWLHVHRTAHKLGLRSNATMLYGTFEEPEDIVDHLLRLRELQDETGGFQAFIPLAFHPANTDLDYLPGPTGFDDLRAIAAGRLLLDNFRYVKSYWVMASPTIAQLSLHFGANDIDGTVREEKIYHMAGARTPMELEERELLRMIREAGRIPAERDTLYNLLREYPLAEAGD